MKRCSGCGEERPLEAFHIDRRQNDCRKSKCRSCTNKVKARWRASNRGRVSSQKRASYERHRDKYLFYMRSTERREKWFRWKLKRQFGITPEDFERLMEAQGGCCAICGKPPEETNNHPQKHRLHIDHCHKTGKVRGLLCNTCNVGLGCFRDSPGLMILAIDYLETRGGALNEQA